MREALARSDLDFVTSEPGKDRRAADPMRLPRILRVASISTAGLVCTVILVNALFLQDRKHPAPLLRAPDPAPALSEALAPTPLPTARPAIVAAPSKATSRDAIADEINRLAATPERKVAKAAPAKSEAEHSDPIAGMLAATPEPSAAVMSAQKALVRLGYVLRADGVFGVTTRQAIERYERDNKLPVRGELTPKLARELAAKSGLSGQ